MDQWYAKGTEHHQERYCQCSGAYPLWPKQASHHRDWCLFERYWCSLDPRRQTRAISQQGTHACWSQLHQHRTGTVGYSICLRKAASIYIWAKNYRTHRSQAPAGHLSETSQSGTTQIAKNAVASLQIWHPGELCWVQECVTCWYSISARATGHSQRDPWFRHQYCTSPEGGANTSWIPTRGDEGRLHFGFTNWAHHYWMAR